MNRAQIKKAASCQAPLRASEIAPAGLVEAGTSVEFNTGDWRANRPKWFKEKCIHCLLCWIACPDSSILLKADKVKTSVMTGIDYGHCKGCGICAKECPVKDKAIIMEEEKK
ncbi:MAG: 4Fe-4S binding protein [Elusimicrobia bacterium]|nr:4Fe-4S binding protein [Elusimicrobiota bacterium]